MAVSPTRKIIAEFILVFMIGGVAGGLFTWSYTDFQQSDAPPVYIRPSSDTPLSAFMSRTNDPDSMVARIDQKYTDEYHLTPDEINRIRPLVTEMAQRTFKIRHQFGLDIMATLDEDHEKIAEQLTPEHRALYEKDIAVRRAKLNSMLLLDQNPPNQEPK